MGELRRDSKMNPNWEAIGAIAEALGAFGVIATLVYLSIQIRHNTRSQRTESRLATARSLTDWYSRVMSDAELVQIWNSGHFNPDQIESEQRDRFIWMISSLFSRFDEVYAQYLSGNVNEAFWSDYRSVATSMLTNPVIRKWWDAKSTVFTEGFVDEIEQNRSVSSTWTTRVFDGKTK